MKKRLIAGVLISAVFLYFSFRNVDTTEFMNSLRHAQYGWVVPSVLCTIAAFWLRAVRWKVILDSVQKVTITQSFSATMIGYMANNVLPFRLGELARIFAIWKDSKVSRASAVGSLILERLFDLIGSLSALGIVLIFFERMPDWAAVMGNMAIGLLIVMALFSILTRTHLDFIIRFVKFLLTPLPDRLYVKTETMLRSFSDGLAVLQDMKKFFYLILLTIAMWVIYVGTLWFMFLSFHYDLGLLATLVLLIFISLAVAIPAAPGYIGTFHGFTVAGLALFNIEANSARAFSVLLHFVNYIPVSILGLYYFWHSQLKIREIEEGTEEVTRS